MSRGHRPPVPRSGTCGHARPRRRAADRSGTGATMSDVETRLTRSKWSTTTPVGRPSCQRGVTHPRRPRGEALQIEHIGPTAVDGLTAKPVIDIQVGVRSLEANPTIIKAMESLKYSYISEFEVEMSFRRNFGKTHDGRRTHQVHLVERSNVQWWDQHVAFRDWLRSYPRDRDAYASLKESWPGRTATIARPIPTPRPPSSPPSWRWPGPGTTGRRPRQHPSRPEKAARDRASGARSPRAAG
jgi:hypothetical protein